MPSRLLEERFALSSRAKRGISFFFSRHSCSCLIALFLATPLAAEVQPARPRITGIDHVRIYVTDLSKSREFYSKLFGVRLRGGLCYDDSGRCFTVGYGAGNQTIELEKVLTPGAKNWLAEIAFATDDVDQMRRYLVAHGVTATRISKHMYDKHALDAHFEVRDPEGNPISFIQRFAYAIDDPPFRAPFYVRILHAGFVVQDRAAEDRFYKDLLGFRLYWHGGMKDDETNWVDMQVPDGPNWVEYMLNISPTADHHTLGVMNHIALGVLDIQTAKAQLLKNGWKPGEEPKLGRDGKWQLNLYDPDDTRVEFMEFTPVEKPCCSEFTGPHPGQEP